MNSKNLNEVTRLVYRRLLERFGEPIGDRPTTYGVSDERPREEKTCESCGGYNEGVCECGMTEAGRKDKGPSKATAKKMLKRAKTFKQKKKIASKWAKKSLGGAAAWLQHRATGKWPRED